MQKDTTISGTSHPPVWLRRFSKLTCFATLFLIFVGGMVTSTGSGLAVPDWPLSYGTLFPPMVGGIFYEHSHRMVAATVGLLTLILALCLKWKEKRRWVRLLGYTALGAVIVQGLLGGLTVLFFLPTWISVSHGILAQTFFVLTIIIAYSQSHEWSSRSKAREAKQNTKDLKFLRFSMFFICLIYTQLFIGALMRHTGAGLAIPDFPTMGGTWWPRFDSGMLSLINHWRFEMNLDPVNMGHVVIHLAHRIGALVVLLSAVLLTWQAVRRFREKRVIINTIWILDAFIILQATLGIMTVMSMKEPVTTSLHVACGAAILGLSTLLFLRIAPVTVKQFQEIF